MKLKTLHVNRRVNIVLLRQLHRTRAYYLDSICEIKSYEIPARLVYRNLVILSFTKN